MKALKACVAVVGIFLLLGLFTTSAKAQNFAELCWHVVNHGEIVGTGKFGITHIEGNYFSIQGGTPDAKIFLSGSGLLVGNEIIFTMSGTIIQDYPEINTKSGQSWRVTIDLATLNGTFWSISTEYLTDGTSNIHYDEGTVEFTSCQ